MTAQIPHRIESHHPTFSLGVWDLYGVIRGDPRASRGWGEIDLERGRPKRAYTADPAPPAEPAASCNWDGYIEVYRIERDGGLVLIQFEYPFHRLPPRVVHERLVGDLMLVLKAGFENVRQYVPFVEGRVVLDHRAWLHEVSIGDSPIAREFRAGCHPQFPRDVPPLWYEQ